MKKKPAHRIMNGDIKIAETSKAKSRVSKATDAERMKLNLSSSDSGCLISFFTSEKTNRLIQKNINANAMRFRI